LRTQIQYAVQQRRVELVKLLLLHGADATLPDAGGCSALDYAVRHEHAELVSLLMPAVLKRRRERALAALLQSALRTKARLLLLQGKSREQRWRWWLSLLAHLAIGAGLLRVLVLLRHR
jgi:ankyrin repeat protein